MTNIAGILLAAAILTGVDSQARQRESAPMNDICYTVELKLGYDAAIERVTAALKAEQFGVVSRIDLHTTFEKKLGVKMLPHTILGACNPKLAHKAVTALPEVAMMLPCNVTVQAIDDEHCVVRIVNARAMMTGAGLEEQPAVKEIGDDADQRLRRVADALRAK